MTSRLAAIAEVISPIQTWNPVSNSQDGTFRYIDLSSVDNEAKIVRAAQEIRFKDAPSRARQLVKRGDILVSTVRPNLNGVAKLDDRFDGATASTGFCVLRPKADKIDQSYLFQWVKSPSFVSDMIRKATGQSYPAVSDRIISESVILLPPLDEQRRIAAILDQADDLRRKRREALLNLDHLGPAVFILTFGSPRANPCGFKAVRLGDIINFVGGSQPPKSTFLYEDGPNRTRFVQIRDFTSDEYKTYIPTSLAKRPFDTDDVMIGRYGPPVFQIFRGLSGSYNVALMKAEPKDGILNDFVYYLLQEPELHSFVVANSERTAGQSGVNLALLDEYPAYFPPVELQQKFAQRIGLVDKLKTQHRAHLAKLDELFASLQHRAFRGEL